MLNINLFESLVVSCFGRPRIKQKKTTHNRNHNGNDQACDSITELNRHLNNHTSGEWKVSILPVLPNFDIDNLYPLSDHVERWNIFIVGNDKTYILASINDIHIPGVASLPNHQAHNIMPKELSTVFDSIWNKTLAGRQLQFYMVWNAKLYFVNTYPFFNGKNDVIGAILFMRAFETDSDSHAQGIALDNATDGPHSRRTSRRISGGREAESMPTDT